MSANNFNFSLYKKRKIENELINVKKSMSNIKELLKLIEVQTDLVSTNSNTTLITVDHLEVLDLLNKSFDNNEDFQKPLNYCNNIINN
jgi:hypothetical protein